MAYLKPPWFTAKIFNRLAMALGIGGSQTLTVTKRGSKQPQQIPVGPHLAQVHGGEPSGGADDSLFNECRH